jgi:hypothetical protein
VRRCRHPRKSRRPRPERDRTPPCCTRSAKAEYGPSACGSCNMGSTLRHLVGEEDQPSTRNRQGLGRSARLRPRRSHAPRLSRNPPGPICMPLELSPPAASRTSQASGSNASML